jgi:hypothetical protein
MIKSQFSQMLIEGNDRDLLIFVYLKDFSKKIASRVLDHYVKKYKDKDFKGLYLTFWDTNFAGDYLGFYKNNSSNLKIAKPLIGTRILKAYYDFSSRFSGIEDITVIG